MTEKHLELEIQPTFGASNDFGRYCCVVETANRFEIVADVVGENRKHSEERAIELVRRWNTHGELLEALIALLVLAKAQGLKFEKGWGESVLDRAESAIAKAGKGGAL